MRLDSATDMFATESPEGTERRLDSFARKAGDPLGRAKPNGCARAPSSQRLETKSHFDCVVCKRGWVSYRSCSRKSSCAPIENYRPALRPHSGQCSVAHSTLNHA
jgi:hypothetical protein